jgi:hypothetical protein
MPFRDLNNTTTDYQIDMCGAALALAAAGVPIFPCHMPILGDGRVRCSCNKPNCEHIGKHPAAHRGHLDATTDRDRITHWWRWERNIGIATGAVSGIDVIDVDPRHNGHRTLAELEARYGALPLTRRARSGGGGPHIYLRHTAGLRSNSGRLGSGIDVKSDGGYVIAPPSLHASGVRYEWTSVGPIAPAPTWLAERFAERRGGSAVAPPERWRELYLAGAAEGQRNDAIARMTGYLLRRGLDPVMVFEIIKEWNRSRFQPPLDEDEVTRTVASICGTVMKRMGER